MNISVDKRSSLPVNPDYIGSLRVRSDEQDESQGSGSVSFTEIFDKLLTQELSKENGGSGSGSALLSLLPGLENYPVYNSGNETAGGGQISESGVDFIASQEGFSATSYRGVDSQNQTIGYGHVLRAGENYSHLSGTQAKELLRQDISTAVDSVNKEFSDTKLNQNQFDALVSFCYNLGPNIWSQVPKLTQDIKSGASADVLKSDFIKCDHCNGQEVQGLLNRRLQEWKTFVS